MRRPVTAPHDPFVVSVVVIVALAGAGLAAVALAWSGTSDLVAVADQLPYVVSGGVGGIALLGFALGLLNVQARRRDEARHVDDLAELVRVATRLAAAPRDDAARRTR